MINFIILSNGKTDFHKTMTQLCIESIYNTYMPSTNFLDEKRIIVIETQKNVTYKKCITIQYDHNKYANITQFNYNYALNQGINYCKKNFQTNNWWCFINNDVVVSENWLIEIEKAVNLDLTLDSICPNIREKQNNILYGYTLWKHLDGCCILCKDSVLQRIGLFDEAFYFYFQDDDYLEQLRLHNIKHGKVMTSLITHIGSQTMKEDNSILPLLFYCRDQFIKKYSLNIYIQREREKQYFKNLQK